MKTVGKSATNPESEILTQTIALTGCQRTRHRVSQPRRRGELHVHCVREPSKRDASPFRVLRPGRISLLLCNGRLPAHDDEPHHGSVPRSLTYALLYYRLAPAKTSWR